MTGRWNPTQILVPPDQLNCHTGVVRFSAKDSSANDHVLPSEQLTQNLKPAELVSGIASLDRMAEAELIVRYRRGVQVILRRTVNFQDVDDLSQDVFLLAVEKIRAGEVREPERLSGFICGLARNLAIGHLRKQSPPERPPEDAKEVEDQSGGPLGQLLRQEDDRAVNRVLAELSSARDREILLRFYLKEEPKERICRDLKIGSLHFNRVLYRARERFRELYSLRTEPG